MHHIAKFVRELLWKIVKLGQSAAAPLRPVAKEMDISNEGQTMIRWMHRNKELWRRVCDGAETYMPLMACWSDVAASERRSEHCDTAQVLRQVAAVYINNSLSMVTAEYSHRSYFVQEMCSTRQEAAVNTGLSKFATLAWRFMRFLVQITHVKYVA
jgi:hypothetical protein